jgi:hypothetical protein
MKQGLAGNTTINGLLIGIVLMLLSSGLLWIIRSQLESTPYWLQANRSVALLALIPNVVVMRFFFINRKADRTGRGILIITFIAMLAIFLLLK